MLRISGDSSAATEQMWRWLLKEVWRLSKYDCPRTEKTDLTRAFMTRYVSVALMYLHLHSSFLSLLSTQNALD